MELLVIICLVVIVAVVLLKRKLSGNRDTSLSTGNPSANEGDDKI
ncbi:hypothetical protein [Nocardia sp. XZ_19_385]|nr:hypothetical protein [Nocardia sp. XZ_19_385]